MRPEPAMFPAGHKGLSRLVAQWADEKLFWAAMAYNFHPRGMAQMFGGSPTRRPNSGPPWPRPLAKTAPRCAPGMPRMPLADATAAYKGYLRRLSTCWTGSPSCWAQPCVADFAAYHPLWFTRTQTPVMAEILDATPAVLAWMDRMAAIGHGTREKLSATDSIALCAASAGAGAVFDHEVMQDDHGIALGSRVSITAESFGPEPTEGELVAATRMHYTLRRNDERAGVVHVHFPRIGYILKKADA
jgi:glutathione S-transferase